MSNPVTLAAAFRVTHDEATNAIIKAAEERPWQELGLPKWLWKGAAGKVAGHLNELLATPIQDVLCGAWKSWRKYEKYTDPTRYPPGKEFEEHEGQFTLKTEHTPRLELQVNGKPGVSLKFPLVLTLEFSGVTFVIRDARFRAVKPGTCTASGKLCCEKIPIKEFHKRTWALPGLIAFESGIPIRPPVPRQVPLGPG